MPQPTSGSGLNGNRRVPCGRHPRTAVWWALMATCSIAGTHIVHASPESRALMREGYAQAYELNFEASLAALAEARRLDPEDPGPLRATAAVTWMEILFLQGVATYAAFQGSPSGDTVARPPVPSHLAARFNGSIQEALSLAQRAVRQSGSADARYQLGATLGLSALYRGTVEGRAFAAFMDGRRAVSIMKELRDAEPHLRESGLVLGIYRYAVSTLPWHRRVLATVVGMPGDKQGGLELLESAAGDGAETASDASLVLMIAYNREGRHRCSSTSRTVARPTPRESTPPSQSGIDRSRCSRPRCCREDDERCPEQSGSARCHWRASPMAVRARSCTSRHARPARGGRPPAGHPRAPEGLGARPGTRGARQTGTRTRRRAGRDCGDRRSPILCEARQR